MKRLILTFVFTSFISASPAYSTERCSETIQVEVNGLVCDFCARALEKVIGKRDDVNSLNVDLDKGVVTIDMKPGHTMDDATLEELITDSGYNIRSIEKAC